MILSCHSSHHSVHYTLYPNLVFWRANSWDCPNFCFKKLQDWKGIRIMKEEILVLKGTLKDLKEKLLEIRRYL